MANQTRPRPTATTSASDHKSSRCGKSINTTRRSCYPRVSAKICTMMTSKTINNTQPTARHTKAIYCLLLLALQLVCATAIPSSQQFASRVADHELDTQLSTANLPKVNPSSEIVNADLHQQQQSTATTTTSTTIANATSLSSASPAPSSSVPSTATASGASELGEDDAADNTTLLIDYNQQDYRSSSEAPSVAASSSNRVPDVASITTLVPGLPADVERVERSTSSALEEGRPLGEMRAKPVGSAEPARDLRNARIGDKVNLNTTEIFETLFKKKPYSKYWTAEQKWDDIFKRFMAIQGTMKQLMMKNFLRDIEYYADVSISQQCADDLKFIQNYTAKSTNMRWMAHMFDSTGKTESGMLTGNLANLGHVVQCIRVRAPARPSNDTFDERFFELQAATLGERFRGKYCLASLRPILPEKPHLVSRFSHIMDPSLLSNISYMGEPVATLKQRAVETSVPDSVYELIDRHHSRLDQIPFESELYEYLIQTRNFAFSLPRFMGVCYPSSCSREDIRYSIQKSVDDQHQVVDIEYECEVDESDPWQWYTTPRLVVVLLLILVASVSFGASLTRHILVDRLQLKQRLRAATSGGGEKSAGTNRLANLLATLDLLSMDKCAGILFIKTKPASPIVDKDKVENNRSTSIDALKGFLTLMLVYSELVHLGCLPVPFMWSKWSDAMFPFFRSYATQIPLNTPIWTEAFYMISAYLIALKLLEDFVAAPDQNGNQPKRLPTFAGFAIRRYIRLMLPMMAFIMFSYVWPRLSNGFVMHDQANKILAPCDNYGWTNFLMFHNYYALNETCLWPSHVSASFFQLHLLSYPILVLLLLSLKSASGASGKLGSHAAQKALASVGLGAALLLALIGLVYSAVRASNEGLIVPFLIDYLDFDNYQRVIEWTVLPTHNHLTSYMAGIMLAYFVVRARLERRRLLSNQRGGWTNSSETYMQREGSLESVVSSSTQELNLKPAFKMNLGSTASSEVTFSSSSEDDDEDDAHSSTIQKWVYGACVEFGLILAMVVSTTASFFWNGLGQPMSQEQTFWYMIGTKLCFTLAFACFFYRHFATRRNSSNPWMITRFLVPVGRMSLMLFYVSWPVIWFDLLASLYQWHPSHYFIFEKYNEIIFMSLIISMFAYGAFEGTVKLIDFSSRAEQLKKRQQKVNANCKLVAGFEFMFQPTDWSEQEQQSTSTRVQQQHHSTGGKSSSSDNQMFSKGSSNALAAASSDMKPGTRDSTSAANKQQVTGLSVPSAGYYKTKGNNSSSPSAAQSASNRKRLSIADQYKLNAELRANYSFASIGLYESAGATDDLPSGQPSPINLRQQTPGAGVNSTTTTTTTTAAATSDTYGSQAGAKQQRN